MRMKFGEEWRHSCGCSEARQMHQEYVHGEDRWATRAERDADPAVASKCKGGGPAVWVADEGWWQCGGCGADLSGNDLAEVSRLHGEWAARWIEAGMPVSEEIGAMIVNDYAVARVEVETGGRDEEGR